MSDVAEAAVQQIAEALAEPNVALIGRIVAVIGPEPALAFLAETLAQETMLVQRVKPKKPPTRRRMSVQNVGN